MKILVYFFGMPAEAMITGCTLDVFYQEMLILCGKTSFLLLTASVPFEMHPSRNALYSWIL
jgi:hypothetical protein